MATYDYPEMTAGDVVSEIEALEAGDAVAFAVASQDRYKLQFSYEVRRVTSDSTVEIQGPEGGQWRFVIVEGRPRLEFKSPSTGWQSAGELDYVEGHH